MNKLTYLLFIIFSCSAPGQQSFETISAEKVLELKNDGVRVFDIRTKREFDQGHIPGVVHVDFLQDGFLQKMKGQGIEDPIVIHCASGGRSARAAKMLKEAGFNKVYDYSGGFNDWISKGLEVEKR